MVQVCTIHAFNDEKPLSHKTPSYYHEDALFKQLAVDSLNIYPVRASWVRRRDSDGDVVLALGRGLS